MIYWTQRACKVSAYLGYCQHCTPLVNFSCRSDFVERNFICHDIFHSSHNESMVQWLACSHLPAHHNRIFLVRTPVVSNQLFGTCIYFFSSTHAPFISKHKDNWLGRNQNNVPRWSDTSAHWQLFQCSSTTKSTKACLV